MDAESLHFNARVHYYKNNDDVWSGTYIELYRLEVRNQAGENVLGFCLMNS